MIKKKDNSKTIECNTLDEYAIKVISNKIIDRKSIEYKGLIDHYDLIVELENKGLVEGDLFKDPLSYLIKTLKESEKKAQKEWREYLKNVESSLKSNL